MGRRKESGLDVVASFPWPVGFVLGIILFLGIRYGIGAYVESAPTGMFKQLGPLLSKGFAPFSWVALVGCWFAAGASFLKAQRRKHLLETQTGLGSIAAMSWQDFERLVGEAFRRRGYAVEETGLGGADGGIDLVLRKDGHKELVQCKQWRSRQVKASVVREMWGLVAHHKANGVKIVCVGDFTSDAKQFAEGKAIELIHGQRLLEMIRDVQATPAPAQTRAASPAAPSAAPLPAPACPKCGGTMIRRINKTTKQEFWGCVTFPKCRGTLQVAPATD
jgi:restriction system protein